MSNGIFNRLQKMRLKLVTYDLKLVYVPGKLMYVADLLSRDNRDEKYNEVDICGTVHFIVSDSCISNDELCEETKKDNTLKQVLEMSKDWSNNKESIPTALRHFWKLRSDIFIDSKIIFFKNRNIDYSSLRNKILIFLHSDHKGIVKSKLKSKEMFYWPAMTNEIENCITKCKICKKYSFKCKRATIG